MKIQNGRLAAIFNPFKIRLDIMKEELKIHVCLHTKNDLISYYIDSKRDIKDLTILIMDGFTSDFTWTDLKSPRYTKYRWEIKMTA